MVDFISKQGFLGTIEKEGKMKKASFRVYEPGPGSPGSPVISKEQKASHFLRAFVISSFIKLSPHLMLLALFYAFKTLAEVAKLG